MLCERRPSTEFRIARQDNYTVGLRGIFGNPSAYATRRVQTRGGRTANNVNEYVPIGFHRTWGAPITYTARQRVTVYPVL